jgi:hypothetical protein
LAYALRQPMPVVSGGFEKRLARWFWRTSYTDYLRIGSRFQTQVNTMSELDQMRDGKLEEWRSTDGMRVEILPERTSFRTARAKVLGLRLAMLQPRDLANGDLLDVGALLSQHQNEALAFVLDRRAAKPSKYAAPENRILYPPAKWDRDRLTLEYIGCPEDSVLSSHILDRECVEYLSSGNHSQFLQRRRNLLMKFESEFQKGLGLVPINNGRQDAEALI